MFQASPVRLSLAESQPETCFLLLVVYERQKNKFGLLLRRCVAARAGVLRHEKLWLVETRLRIGFEQCLQMFVLEQNVV